MNRRAKFLTYGLVVSIGVILPLVGGAFAQQNASNPPAGAAAATSVPQVTVPPLDATPPQGQPPAGEVEGEPPVGWVPPAEQAKSVAKTAAPVAQQKDQKAFNASGEVVSQPPVISNYITQTKPFQPWIALNTIGGIVVPYGSGNINDFNGFAGLELQVGVSGYAHCNISAGAACMVLSPFVQADYTYHRYPGIATGSVALGGEIWFPFATSDPRSEDGKKLAPWIGPFAQFSMGARFSTQYEDPNGLPPFLRLQDPYAFKVDGRIGAKVDITQFLPRSERSRRVQLTFAIDFSTTPNGSAVGPVVGVVVFPFEKHMND